MRPQRPNSFHAMLADLLDTCGRKHVEAELGRSLSIISRWTDPGEENGRRMPAPDLDLLCRLFPAGAAVVARHFASLAGGVYVPIETGDGDVSEASATVVLRFAEANANIMAALGQGSKLPGDLTPEEAETVHTDLTRLYDAMHRLTAIVQERREDPARLRAVAEAR
ncbi:hypothetical protein [Oceanicella sp. SM1341]|uniref:hypothetical protein n=1 Tax=Oceanicella sp. SM1341 TaxID=1548889 RepID=UPI000E4F68FF|nr:hypothetical protein [Oceanicella sp. SM1341]